MIEKLFALDFPPGLVNNGTTYQSKNRWYSGNLVRFYQGSKQPIGGWVQRTLTGATIAGVPNAAVAWQDNAGNSWLAVGTTTGLYVVSALNVVTDITPAVGYETGGQPTYWQLDTFGSYLVAVYNGSGTNPSGYVNGFYWAGSVAARAVQFQASVLLAPSQFYGVGTTAERFLMLLRGTDEAVLGDPASGLRRAEVAGADISELVP